ncbi:SGNH/GDSL hydrolase family protein [Azohydromonas aeria]|uniref:SGNH/GDSL hydrolase family protein n=1 Tax=Azohydromonas aeria TaxID=2590212 RepID=UPI001E614AB9|nr:SGNH/GDSL hydrolase family protein [Azohydromonas aeria]
MAASALLGATLVAAAAVPAPSDAAPAAPQARVVDAKWRADFEAFDAADKARPVQPGGVLFVGSSSIRLWDDLEQQFQELPVLVKRGFGGSQLSDCAAHLDRLVVAYQPRLVVLYAGDNDLNAGRTPQQVFDSYQQFVDGVHRALPDTRIAYVSIKPSPSRAKLLPQVREANALIRQRAAADPRLDYIDIYQPMLGADGQPRAELFREDRLHLNAQGYALWHQVIARHLR